MKLYLLHSIEIGLAFDNVILILLFFADDMAIIGKSPIELQYNVDFFIFVL
jgi:hypothetical protein